MKAYSGVSNRASWAEKVAAIRTALRRYPEAVRRALDPEGVAEMQGSLFEAKDP